MATLDEVIHFWFEELTPEDHWKKSDALDSDIRARFAALHGDIAVKTRIALTGGDGPEVASAEQGLAEIIVLDQFSRNMFRDTPDAFASDGLALAIARVMVAAGMDMRLPVQQRQFIYMPYEHSEDMAVQKESVKLFAERCDTGNAVEYAWAHYRVIEQFGRFPHRNGILGRKNTAEEDTYLAKPGAGF